MNEGSKRILLIGAGEAARMIVSQIKRHGELGMHVVGFLDDSPELEGSAIDSVPVLGKTDALEDIVAREEVDEVIIAIPTAPGRFVRKMVQSCGRAGICYKIVPGIIEIIKGDVSISQVREVQVEDLMGRETVEFELDLMKETLSGKRVLVTGAGGTIGSELCRYISRVEPAELILLGRGENRIFEIEEELRTFDSGLNISTVINNLREPERTERIIDGLRPDVIYHTAAHKHVHYMENDPEEAVLNNIGGTINLVKACLGKPVERFIFISTDKAANPRGVMGATKRAMELYLSEIGSSDSCRFISVRFGNVIGSTGSVVPLFLKQIRRGGPVTVSHEEATRYFMTVKEAALLVLKASLIGKGGEIFILDMGEAINIMEMARDMILLSGHDPDDEIPVCIVGLREGEKLHEELVNEGEELVPSGIEKIFIAESSVNPSGGVGRMIEKSVKLAAEGRKKEMIKTLKAVIPGFGS